MQRFAVSQKNRSEAITISAFSLSLLYNAKNREFSTLRCKNRRRPTEIECRLFCCPILLSRCRFCSFLKLLSYRHTAKRLPFLGSFPQQSSAIQNSRTIAVISRTDAAAITIPENTQRQTKFVFGVVRTYFSVTFPCSKSFFKSGEI